MQSIQAANGGHALPPVLPADCGCELRPSTDVVRLCVYHRGFADGVDAVGTSRADERWGQ
jgi:hypothetical protein